MPIYEYECAECKAKFELIKKNFDESANIKCIRCGKETKRLISTSKPIFKGSGFYETDYKNKGA